MIIDPERGNCVSETPYVGNAMQDLASQILKRVPEGATISRADLSGAANYDSIGRVLRRLVAERKLVRVGRGRYQRAQGKRVESNASIGEAIGRRLARSKRNVFLRTDFAKLGSYDAVGRSLRQLVERGRLVQIGYGLYAKAERSPVTGKPAPLIGIRRLTAEALRRLGKSVGESESQSAYNAGRSTQVPTGRVVTVQDRVSRRIGYDGNYVVLTRT